MRHHYEVKTYDELRKWAAKFASSDSDLHSLIIFGAPGTGKTETFTQALADEYLITIKGRLTAFQLFQRIKEHTDALFLFDDTRRILKDFECVNLLMALGENKKPKVIQWNTSTLTKAKGCGPDSPDDNPNETITNSRIVIVINRVDEDDEDLEPLVSRSIVIHFSPSKEAVHEYVGEWFLTDEKSNEIYDYIGNHLPVIPIADVRDYTKSHTIHDMNWREQLNQAWTGDEYLSAVLTIINDPSIPAGKVQVERFSDLCGGSRAQFFRLKNKLMPLRHAPVSQSHDLIVSGHSRDRPVQIEPSASES